VEPIERVAPDADALASAIERAVAASDLSLGARNLRSYKSPLPKAVGLRSNKQFDDSVRCLCAVRRSEVHIQVAMHRRAPDGRGFVPTERMVELAPTASTMDIAQAVLRLTDGDEER
jgi:hypothetical protein